MKKISELSGDDFFDVIYALSPVLSVIGDMEIIQAQLFNSYNEKISRARSAITANKILLEKGGDPSKNDEYQQKINEAEEIVKSEITKTFTQDVTRLIPFLTSKENRSCVFETLSILDELPIEEIKKYPPPKLISKIMVVIKDTDFKSFLSYAEASDAVE